jgi:arsenite methyltransferase
VTSARFDAAALGRAYDVVAVREQRARTRELLGRVDGTALDLGCGPGHLAAELAATARVVAVDREPAMLTATRERAGTGVVCLQAEATALPLADEVVDAAAVVQVLEHVPDVPQALAELRRVLRPGGRAVLVDTDWRSCVWHSDDRDRTDRVLRVWEDHFVHPHLPAALPGLARAAGFDDVAVRGLALVETDTTADTYSRGMAGTIARFVGRREPELAEAWRGDLRRQAERGTWWFALTRIATVVTRG